MPVQGGFGTHAWTERTSGVLSWSERWRTRAKIAREQPRYAAGLVRLVAGRTSRRGAGDLTWPTPPDTPLARAAEQAWKLQRCHVRRHSCRTWVYGHALALLDKVALDAELFYVACLLHDYGLEQSQPGQDFTLRSAERAMACVREVGASEDAARAVADAITLHVTPGIRLRRDGALGCYLQEGSLLDLAGDKAWKLPRAYRDAAVAKHPRDGVTEAFVTLVRDEARANPRSRFGLLSQCGLTLAFRFYDAIDR